MENYVFIVFLYSHTCHNKHEMHLDYNNHHRHNDRRECWCHPLTKHCEPAEGLKSASGKQAG